MKLKDFVSTAPRFIPIIIMADISGSMKEDGKIETLNDCLESMFEDFSDSDDTSIQFKIVVITFGKEGAKIHQDLTLAGEIVWKRLEAAGKTPIGEAFIVALDLINDQNKIPGTAYRPAVVMVSDGKPTDSWREPLKNLLGSERGKKASRYAIGIGDDADEEMLKEFLADEKLRVFRGHEAHEIQKFFQFVTMSEQMRSRNPNPNSVIQLTPEELENDDY